MNTHHTHTVQRTRESGSAMVMVLLILGVLLVISVPFLISMTRHGINARSYQAGTRTDQLTEFGHRSSAGIMTGGHTEEEWNRRNRSRSTPSTREQLFKYPVFNTPYMDYTGEFQLVQKELANHFLFNAFDDRRSIGIQLEDEQGKINVRTAPEEVIDQLKELVSSSESMDRYVTQHSVRPRVHTVSTTVERNQEIPGRLINWTTTRHPVNVNTADWKVLAAIFTGIGGRSNRDSEESDDSGEGNVLADTSIDRNTARNVARFIRDRTPLNDWYQLRYVLKEADKQNVISSDEEKAIRLNAMRGNVLNESNRYNISTSVPLCFRNFNRFSVRSRATTLNPAGIRRSTSAVKRVVSTSPRSSSHVLESGYEFAGSMDGLRKKNGIRRTNSFGFIVGPGEMYNDLSKSSLSFEPDQLGTWAKTEKMKNRDNPAHIQPKPNSDGKFSPFGTSIAGASLSKGAFDGGESYTENSSGVGGIKFWVKFDGVPQSGTLFDSAKSTYESRIHLYYRAGKLFLDVAGPELDRKYTRISGRWQPQEDTWYHVAAFWKSSKFGHLALMIDGHVIGGMHFVDEEDQQLEKTISTSLPASGSGANLSSLPDGHWQIGEEVINVRSGTTSSGAQQMSTDRALTNRVTTPHEHPQNSLARPYGFSVELEEDAAEHTSTHSAEYLDEDVTLQANMSGIPKMNIRTTVPFGSVNASVCPEDGVELVEPDDPEQDPYFRCSADSSWSLGAEQNEIPLRYGFPRSPENVPSPALLLIEGRARKASGNGGGNNQPENDDQNTDDSDDENKPDYTHEYEVVRCEEATESALENCTRGVLGSEARDWLQGADVELFGFPVSGASSYPEEQRVVQLDHEWIGPVKPYTVGGTSFLGTSDERVPLPRNLHGTFTPETHQSGTRVLPVFSLEREDREQRWLAEGENIRNVTLIDDENEKERMRVNVSRVVGGRRPSGNHFLTSRASLNRSVESDVKAENAARLVKFPSGELLPEEKDRRPSAKLGSTHPQADPVGSMQGDIANLKSVDGSGSYLILDSSSSDTAGSSNTSGSSASSEITIRGSQFSNPGALKVGDTIFGYPETETSSRTPESSSQSASQSSNVDLQLTTLNELTRNYLQTDPPEPNYVLHRGDNVFRLSDGLISVGALTDPITAQSTEVSIEGNGSINDGYVRIGAEILNLDGGQMPFHPVTNQGMFRGSFGTVPQAHPQKALVFRMPYRFPDRVPEAEVNRLMSRMIFHVVEANRPDATWTGVSWDVDTGQRTGSAPRMLIRSDRDRPWHRVNRRYTLKGRSPVKFDTPIPSDRIEVLLLFDYEDGAWGAQDWRNRHGWKTTTRLERLELNYRTPSRTYEYREQK